MKTIFLLRHAKSSWKNLDISDADRPLKSKGVSHAYFMAEKLKQEFTPELIFCSPAARAMHTASIFCRVVNFDYSALKIEPVLYHHSSIQEIVQILRELPSSVKSVALVGHNPSMHELYESLGDQELTNFSTGSLAKIEFDINSWEELPLKGKAIYFEDKSLLL